MESQIYQWIVLGIVVAFIAIEKAKKLFSNKSNPGYGERIASLESSMKDIERRLERIEDKLNGMG